jgi:hypothetical protein
VMAEIFNGKPLMGLGKTTAHIRAAVVDWSTLVDTKAADPAPRCHSGALAMPGVVVLRARARATSNVRQTQNCVQCAR